MRYGKQKGGLLVITNVKEYLLVRLEEAARTPSTEKTVVIYERRRPTRRNTKYIAIQNAVPPYVFGTYSSSTAIRNPPRDLVFIAMETAEHLFTFRRGKITKTKTEEQSA